jgi:hypothetical protein
VISDIKYLIASMLDLSDIGKDLYQNKRSLVRQILSNIRLNKPMLDVEYS